VLECESSSKAGIEGREREGIDPSSSGRPALMRNQSMDRKTISSAPSQRTDRPRSPSRSAPDVMVRKWLPASGPILLAKAVLP
jgi:hypothetical protein